MGKQDEFLHSKFKISTLKDKVSSSIIVPNLYNFQQKNKDGRRFDDQGRSSNMIAPPGRLEYGTRERWESTRERLLDLGLQLGSRCWVTI